MLGCNQQCNQRELFPIIGVSSDTLPPLHHHKKLPIVIQRQRKSCQLWYKEKLANCDTITQKTCQSWYKDKAKLANCDTIQIKTCKSGYNTKEKLANSDTKKNFPIVIQRKRKTCRLWYKEKVANCDTNTIFAPFLLSCREFLLDLIWFDQWWDWA